MTDALSKGTVVFNSAGAHIPELGTVCLAAIDAFEMPNCLNLYVTQKGTSTSAPPHTDKQDVFVLQSAGAKRWSRSPPASTPPYPPLLSRRCPSPHPTTHQEGNHTQSPDRTEV